jgi:hypothetical protein
MMGAIHKEPPPEHWDNSMTTRTLLLVCIVPSQQNFRCRFKASPFGQYLAPWPERLSMAGRLRQVD